jgi:PAS domain S-box-containing protein
MREELKKSILEIEKTEAKLSSIKKKLIEQDSFVFDNEVLSDSKSEELADIQFKVSEKEKTIQEKEKFLKIGRWSYNFDVLEWSDEMYKIFEYPENFEGTVLEFYMTCVDYKTAARLKEQSDLLKNPPKNSIMNQVITTPLGNKKLLSFTSNPIHNDAGEIIGIEGLTMDISDKITGSKGLEKFFDLSMDLHCILHLDMYFIKVSPAWTELLGYTEKELLSRSFIDFVHPEDVKKSTISPEDVDNWDSTTTFENRYISKSGETVFLSWNSKIDKETKLLYCTARNITKSTLEKDELLSDLSGKELLLREIHHRVKNNLQIISSLLSLQAGANRDEERLLKLYQDSQSRIKSMAAIHEMFYQSEQLDKIEFGKYMKKLINDLSISFASAENAVNFTIEAEPVYLNLDSAIPLGLIINEVVTNSIKHGGDKDGNVLIFVKMRSLSDGKLQLTIGDTGVNGIKNVLSSSDESLGVLLINSLVDQIDGEIKQMNNCGGTTFQMIFSDAINSTS